MPQGSNPRTSRQGPGRSRSGLLLTRGAARPLDRRRLRTFERQPLGAAPSERQLLEAWYEEGLKHVYAGFAQLVVHGTTDNVLHSKQLMVRMLANMLGGAPELERELLPALVNKLGDPEKKVASRLTHLMHALLHQHPAMKPVLLAEVRRPPRSQV